MSCVPASATRIDACDRNETADAVAASNGAPPTPSADVAAFWTAVFGNVHPVCLDIGSGRGEFLQASARQRPEKNFLGIERSARRVREIEARMAALQLANVRVLRADAPCVMRFIPDQSVARCYILFPDPWWKRRHHRRRLITAAFVSELRRTLVPGGALVLVTDVAETFALAQRYLDADPELERIQIPDSFEISTSFARKARARGDRLHASIHQRRLASPHSLSCPADAMSNH